MKLIASPLPEVVIVEPAVFGDDRGWFMESFNEARFNQGLQSLGLPKAPPFVQDNHSTSRTGVLRGLHFQRTPHAQGKLVRVVQGSVFDVAVDIRPDSPRRGQWFGVELSASNKRQLWIPPGFAHGFLTLEDDTQFLYKTTDVWVREAEGCVAWNDPELGIDWPLNDLEPLLAPKDAQAPRLRDAQIA